MTRQEQVKKDIVDQLYWDHRVNASDVKVNLQDGHARLEGTVPSFTAWQAAEEDTWIVPGVTNVINDLNIRLPESLTVPTDDEIKDHLRRILVMNPDLAARDLTLEVINGTVKLEGTVDALWKKLLARDLAYGVTGVVRVDNRLAVTPTHDVVDKVVAEDVVSALRRNAHVDSREVDVKVDHGKVTLLGQVPNALALREARAVARHTPGVVNVEDHLSLS